MVERERLVTQLCLLFWLGGMPVSAVSLLSCDVILAQLACPLNDIIFVYIRNN